MQKDNGDTEVVFIGALLMWGVAGTFGWLANIFYESWQNGEVIEFSSRKMAMLDLLPMNMKFYLFAFITGVFTFYSVKLSKKFIYLCRTKTSS
ncbi:MAG: hypothetical protein U9Q87_17000 [Pseudomonadota bacterium]|jgi:hypothetical protein|nr:hypothetical protein [Pseudomonadota bacterium]|tara:strand:+ start:765 stop:1043 length:279 start_codon:yes stop_codon:yes gene_type:complete